MKLKNLGLTALSGLCAGSNDPDVWAELISRVQPIFGRVSYRVAAERGYPNPSEIDDIVQSICFKLGTRGPEILRLVPSDNDQAAAAYFRVLAANVARDYFKSKYAQKRGVTQTVSGEMPLASLSASLGSPRHLELDILIREIDAILPEDSTARAVFWLYYRQGFTAKEIAAVPGMNLTAKGVESLIHRLTLAVRDKLQSEAQRTMGDLSRDISKGEVTPEAS